MKSFKVDTFNINQKSKIFLIAECGVNHNGKLKYAFKLIDEAKKSGFDAVKFQTYLPELLVHPQAHLASYQKKTKFSNQKKMLEKYFLSFENFITLSKYCKKKKIIFLSTPFDNVSAKFLNSIKVPAFKISSADIDNFHLLQFVKKFNKPIILSTGMSNQNKIDKTLNFLNLNHSNLALMHCVSEYPTKIYNSNLGYLEKLKKKKLFVGISDHSSDTIVPYASCALGIKMIEKHITLSKLMKGPDHLASLEVKKLKNFVENIREIEFSLNDNMKKISKEETNNLKAVSRKFFFSKKLKKGQKILYTDIIPLRSSNKKGVIVNNLNKVINSKLKKNVKKLEVLTWKKIRKK
jgi:N,N'-diacetyllegionaminate synthase